MDKPNSKALRKFRVSLPNHIYHITTTTKNRQPVFNNHIAARVAAKLLWKIPKADGQTLSYVVMPDHIHWLLELSESGHLPTTVKRYKASTAVQVNRLFKTQGAFWQSGYHEHALRSDESLVAVARYVVANPLRAGVASGVGDYPYWNSVWL